MIEIEMKAKITSQQRNYIKQWCKNNCNYVGHVLKRDNYLKSDSSNKNFRIREEYTCNKNQKAIVTIKERTLINECECNNEVEFSISDVKAFSYFSNMLGYKTFIKKDKISYLYKRGQYSIEINSVRFLGDFIEIEYLCDNQDNYDTIINKIKEQFALLGISPSQVETKSYTQLLNERGKEDSDKNYC